MEKTERQVDSLYELLKEQAEINQQIDALPRGYISVKKISGHVYNYRQWREGSHIVSQYVPDTLLSGVKRKIAARKEQEVFLKSVKKEIKSVSARCFRLGLLTEKGFEKLQAKALAEVKGE